MKSASAPVAVVACGALAGDVATAARERGWAVDVTVLDPLLHNRPAQIAPAVDEELGRISQTHQRAFVAYADCGTYGALDRVLDHHRRDGFLVDRLPGSHCYDVYAGVERIAALLAEEPGTYLLTDYLVRAFDRLVVRELGLDRWPELREDYFGRYTRVVWLRTTCDPALEGRAGAAAATLGLRLEVVDVARLTLPILGEITAVASHQCEGRDSSVLLDQGTPHR